MKNLLLLSAMLLFSALAYSQLYVSPNGATDSYVYVDNQILFVEQDVNLDANNAGTTEASVYLRNDAQLIQGTTSSSNSGTGFISVYQDTPNDDSWDYTFWGSPIGNQTLGGSGNQNFGILSVNDALSVTNSNVTATTTVVNGIETPLTISRRWIYRRPAGSGWLAMHLSNSVTAGHGFIMKGVGLTNHNQLYDFRGRPNNGDISVAVQTTRVTLSGNPYPSALDLNRVFYDTSSSDINGTMNPGNSEITEFRYWDEDRTIDSHLYTANKGGYGTWVPGASEPNGTNPGMYTVPLFLNYDQAGNPSGGSTGSGSTYQRRFAPIGQGYHIYAGFSTGSIVYKNQHRRYIIEGTANNSDFRNQESPGTSADDVNDDIPDPDPIDPNINPIPHIRIYTTFAESHFRDMFLAFADETTIGFDRGYDARHPMDAVNADIYFPIPNPEDNQEIMPLVIQTRPFEYAERIPVTLELDQQTKIQLEAVEEINMPVDRAYLLDRTENRYWQITGGEKAEFIMDAGVYEDRFFIVFRGEREMVTDLPDNLDSEKILANVDFFQNNPAAQLEVSNPEGYDIKQANIFDMSGKLVYNGSNLGNSTRITFPTGNFSDGVYLVKLTTVDNVTIDYKISVFNK